MATPAPAQLLERIFFYRQVLFNDSQRRMAECLGFSQALVSKIHNRSQRPTEAFLEALASQPLVNRRWLLEGEGEPLLPSIAGTLAVANVILPGPPAEYAGLLTGERYPVATAWDISSRYWLRLSSEAPLVRMFGSQLRSGDLLLVETARDHLDRLDIVNGQLCAISEQSDQHSTYAFAKVTVEAGKLQAMVYDAPYPPHFVEPDSESKSKESLDQVFVPKRRKVTRRQGEKASQVGSGSMPVSHSEDCMLQKPDVPAFRQLTGTDDIVGIVLMLQRPLPLLLVNGDTAMTTQSVQQEVQRSEGESQGETKEREIVREDAEQEAVLAHQPQSVPAKIGRRD